MALEPFFEENELDILKQKILNLENELSGLNPRNLAGIQKSDLVKATKIVFPSDYTAGESLANADWVRIALSDEEIFNQITGATGFNMLGAADGVRRCAQGFKIPVATTTLRIVVKLTNDVAARVFTGRLHSDSAGSPGTVLDTKTVTPDVVTASEVTFDFGANTLTADTQYHFSFSVDNTGSGTNALIFHTNGSDVYSDGTFKTSTDSGSNWSDTSGDAYFRIYITEDATGGKLYKCSAQTSSQTNKLVGVVNAPASSGATVQGMTRGTKDDYASSLTAGSIYYLSDTRGAIATIPGTVSKTVGLATTTKILEVRPNL